MSKSVNDKLQAADAAHSDIAGFALLVPVDQLFLMGNYMSIWLFSNSDKEAWLTFLIEKGYKFGFINNNNIEAYYLEQVEKQVFIDLCRGTFQKDILEI